MKDAQLGVYRVEHKVINYARAQFEVTFDRRTDNTHVDNRSDLEYKFKIVP